jgi:hypothetical protein
MVFGVSTTCMEAWRQGHSRGRFSSPPVRIQVSSIIFADFHLSFITRLAGIKPALAAATVMSGLAGVWSYVKRHV